MMTRALSFVSPQLQDSALRSQECINIKYEAQNEDYSHFTTLQNANNV